MCDEAKLPPAGDDMKVLKSLRAMADEMSDRQAQRRVARLEVPVKLTRGLLTFAVFVALVLCVGVPLVLLLCGHTTSRTSQFSSLKHGLAVPGAGHGRRDCMDARTLSEPCGQSSRPSPELKGPDTTCCCRVLYCNWRPITAIVAIVAGIVVVFLSLCTAKCTIKRSRRVQGRPISSVD